MTNDMPSHPDFSESLVTRAMFVSPGRPAEETSHTGTASTTNVDQPGGDDPLPRCERPQWKQGLLFNVVVPLCLLACGGAAVLALGTVESEQRAPADFSLTGRLKALPVVRVERLRSLESTSARLHLNAEGNVVPFRESRIASEIAGQITWKSDNCEAGNFVAKGDVLMRIDPTDYELEVQRLSRLKEQEYQALQEVDQEMVNTNRLIEVAKRDVELQQQELNRLVSLPENFASRAEIDQAERGLLQARQQLLTLQNQIDLSLKRRVRLQAAEELAATQLKAAEVNLKRTTIKSPIDGVIVREEADVNSFVSRGSTLLTIEDVSKVEVASRLRMDQLYWVLDQREKDNRDSKRGYDLPDTEAIIEYKVSGRDDAVYRWQGRLLSYDGIGMDPATRTVPVRIVVDNPQQYVDQQGTVRETNGPTPLVRGMYVQVRLLVEPKTPLVVVPGGALRPGNRVWQFLADDSVLEDPSPNSDAEGSVEAVSSDAEINDTSDRFIPHEWMPGRVFVRKSVTPVDSLVVELDDPAENERSRLNATDVGYSKRYWVCEVGNQAMGNGAMVVVSPLGSIDDDGIAARTRVSESGRVTRETSATRLVKFENRSQPSKQVDSRSESSSPRSAQGREKRYRRPETGQ